MNKLLKIIIAIFGGVNTIFSIFIPTIVALLLIGFAPLNSLNQFIVMIAGLGSTLYRAVSNLIPLIE